MSVVDRAAIYRCPGEAQPIEHSIHLARLASFYPACRECPARESELRARAALTAGQQRDWREVDARHHAQPEFTPEGLAGHARDLTPRVAEAFAIALAQGLWRRQPSQPPTILLGTDGHWSTVDAAAAAARWLALCGCRVLEAGAATSPALATASQRLAADAALWLGSDSGDRSQAAIKLWTASGIPASHPGSLTGLIDDWRRGGARPKRRGGTLARVAAAEHYLPTLAGMYHGLRPLVFVLDTTSTAVVEYWQSLSASSACRAVRPQGMRTGGQFEFLAREVRAAGAHFGVWIGGDGETCQLVDERGRTIAPARLLRMLAPWMCRDRSGAAIVLECRADDALTAALGRSAACVSSAAGGTREAMARAMQATDAVLGGGASGRFWFAGPPAAPDALACLSLLLLILSQSDRPLSEVLDSAVSAG